MERGLFTLFVFVLLLQETVAHIPGYGSVRETEVNVELIQRTRTRARRSISQLRHIQADYEYHVRVSTIGQQDPGFVHDLKLVPSESIFGPNFHYTELGTDEFGNEKSTKWRPSAEELDNLQSQIYVDPSTATVVKLDESNGHVELDGVVNGGRIRAIRRRRRDVRTEEIIHLLTSVEPDDMSEPTPPNDDDYMIITEQPLSLTGRAREEEEPDNGEWIGIEPELVIVIDYDLGQSIGGDRTKKLEYAAITVNGINIHYELTNSTLGIKCELVGVVVMESRDQLVGNLTPIPKLDKDGTFLYNTYHHHHVLAAYQRWLYQNPKTVGLHDLAPLLAGVDIVNPGAGVAGIKGACRVNHSQGTPPEFSDMTASFVNDRGAIFYGIPVLAHEIGHSFGAPHDAYQGEPANCTTECQVANTEACLWTDGYLMSYNRTVNTTTHQFSFSTCSLAAMRKYIRSPTADCLSPHNKTGRPIAHETKLQAGDLISAEDFCLKFLENAQDAVPKHVSPDQMCRSFYCVGMRGGKPAQRISSYPGYNMPCGNNKIKGKCRNGWCINQGPPVDADALCKLLTGDPLAYFNKTETDALSNICSRTSKFPCVFHKTSPKKEAKLQSMDMNTNRTRFMHFVVPGTSCGEGHVCFNQSCVELVNIRDPNKDCILRTGKQGAVQVNFVSTHVNCTPSIKCVYGSEFEYKLEGSTNSCTGKDGREGACFDGGCVLEPTTTTTTPTTSTASTQKLNPCTNAPDGTMCGPLRRCRNGECVKCGSH